MTFTTPTSSSDDWNASAAATAPASDAAASPKYRLVIRQQPEKARLCSYKERVDRRPLDPPPIIQLFTNQSEHSYSRFFLYASLVDKDGDVDLTLRDHSRTTAGMVVQSLHKLKDMNDQDGTFFVFSDVSVRLEGYFRLRFTLFEISGLTTHRRCSVLSDIFQVYSPKTFPGMSESTPLTQFLSKQGLHIRIRKTTKTHADSPPSKRRKMQVEFPEWKVYHPPSSTAASAPHAADHIHHPHHSHHSHAQHAQHHAFAPSSHPQVTTAVASSSTPPKQCIQSIMSVKNILISPSQHQDDPPPPRLAPLPLPVPSFTQPSPPPLDASGPPISRSYYPPSR